MTSSQLIDAKIEELADWRGAMLGKLRKLIHQGRTLKLEMAFDYRHRVAAEDRPVAPQLTVQ
jgi:hypothetical protein